MKQYLDIVDRVLKKGKWKGNRTGVRTLTCANVCFSHDMEDGFPLLTTKKMALRVLAVELEGFVKGITSKEWYQQRGCRIWDEWANPVAVKEFYEENYEKYQKEYEYNFQIMDDAPQPSFEALKKPIQRSVDDLGPIYGYQWRNFGGHYGEWKFEDVGEPNAIGEYQQTDNRNGVNKGTDQLKTIIDTLKTNPNDRRMVCSAWNPNQINMMALPPCHYAWNVVVIEDTINLFWAQRSCDLMLGVPFNIASYALLLCLLAKESGLRPGNLSGMLCDCHIYENHLDGAYEQVNRKPYELPTVEINSKGILDWTHQDLKLLNYNSHPKINFEVAI